jgi:hypothetical protein
MEKVDLSCDGCGVEVKVTRTIFSSSYVERPEDWCTLNLSGKSVAFRSLDVCPQCVMKLTKVFPQLEKLLRQNRFGPRFASEEAEK